MSSTPASPSSSPTSTTHHDLITISAMAIVAYLLAAFIHEGLGHGFVALIVGARPTHVTSLDLAYDATKVGLTANRAIAAAGCLAQFAVATVLLFVLRSTPDTHPQRRYFLWLLKFINYFIPFGYLMALSFAPFGDWNDFVQGLPQPVLWRLGLTAIGIGGSLWTLFAASRAIQPFLGDEQQQRKRNGLVLCLVPYLVGSATNTLAGIFNPDGAILVLISAAAATFGGTAWLAWTSYVAPMFKTASAQTIQLTVTRQTGWLIAGGIALIIYFAVLGPGVPR